MQPMDAIEQARVLFQQALTLHNAHRFSQAEQLYRKALELAPDRTSVLINLSAVLIAQNRHSEARPLCERVLSIEPGQPQALDHIQQCDSVPGGGDARLAALDSRLMRDPDNAGLHSNRALVLHELGRHSEALQAYQAALALEPSAARILTNRGQLFEDLDQVDQALLDYFTAIRLDATLEQAGYAFARLVTLTGRLPTAPQGELDALLVRMISHPWIAPQLAAPTLIRRARQDVRVDSVLRQPDVSESDLDAIFFASVSDDAARTRAVQIALMKNVVVADPGLEFLYTALRRSLLVRALHAPEHAFTSAHEAVACALAAQCFLNEYVFALDEWEQTAKEDLTRSVTRSLDRNQSVPGFLLAVVASYLPLHSIPGIDAAAGSSYSPTVSELIRRQLREPREEQSLRQTIPALTPITDSVSDGVRKQYEQNPYPRWSSLPVHLERLTFPDFLGRRLPGVDPQTLPGRSGTTVRVLNAGCGTGQHPINMVLRVRSLNVLAVDLSLSSLAHAVRKARDLGVSDIRFAQADILELGSTGLRFDVIESMGVLHHLASPASGLATLCSLLEEGGLIRLGLYSEAGRRSVIACREDIGRRQLESSAERIRAYRAELKAASADDPRRGAMTFADFYSLSECRDLLFHVQEHQFTLPKLRELIEQTGLEFLGFDLEPDQVASFKSSYPDPSSMTDLDAWHEHETRHPSLFSRMYIFWARKRPR